MHKDLLKKGNSFFKQLMTCVLGLPTGDLTNEAIARLAKSFPTIVKYKTISEGVKLFLCKGAPEDIRLLRVFGNIGNAKRELQPKMDFPGKVLQMHRAAVQFDNMAETGGPEAQKKTKAALAFPLT